MSSRDEDRKRARRSRSRDRSRRKRYSSSESRSRSRSPPRRARKSGFSAAPPGTVNQYSALAGALAGGLSGGMSGAAGMAAAATYSAMLPTAGLMQMVDPQTKTQRELYVGNLPTGIMEFQLKEFLGQCIMQAELNTMPGSSVMQCRVSGKFAFSEFRSIEETNLAMNLKGALFQGSVLDVKRPAKYNGPMTDFVSYGEYVAKHKPDLFGQAGAPGLPEGGAAAATAAGDPDTKMHRELYIGNVPPGFSEAQLQEFFNNQMNARHLTTKPGIACIQTRISQGFAFAEFRSVEETNLALAHLNYCEVGGAQLRIGRPKKYEDQVPQEQQQQALRQAQEQVASAASKMQKPTCALQFSNMVTPMDLQNTEELQEIEEDITIECQKYGDLEKLHLIKTGLTAGKVYAKFADVQSARVAKAALQGRKFGSSSVDCWFYEPERFDKEEWVDMHMEFGPCVDLMNMPMPAQPSQTHRASKMVDGKWKDIGPVGAYGMTGIP